MLDIAKVTRTSLMQELQTNVPFLTNIHSSDEHEEALALIETLLDDYDNNLALLDVLNLAIERYDN